MKNIQFVATFIILALGAGAIPALAKQWTFERNTPAGFGLFVANATHSAIAGLVAIPEVSSILLLGTGLLCAGTLIRLRVRKAER